MSNITTFNFDALQVRAVLRDGEPWFVAADVCAALEIVDVRQAVERLDDSERGGCTVPTPGGLQEVRAVNESGLYALIFTSRKPEAQRFRRWVTSDVLPSIRRTGQYVALKPAAEERPISLEAEIAAAARVLSDDRLKALFPLLWQDITDGMQNALRRTLGTPLALPAPDAPKLLDVVEIAKSAGIDLPTNLRGAAGKYVKARVTAVETERLINGAIRKSSAYADHAAVASALREYIAGRSA